MIEKYIRDHYTRAELRASYNDSETSEYFNDLHTSVDNFQQNQGGIMKFSDPNPFFRSAWINLQSMSITPGVTKNNPAKRNAYLRQQRREERGKRRRRLAFLHDNVRYKCIITPTCFIPLVSLFFPFLSAVGEPVPYFRAHTRHFTLRKEIIEIDLRENSTVVGRGRSTWVASPKFCLRGKEWKCN